jgi:hypothetical protein
MVIKPGQIEGLRSESVAIEEAASVIDVRSENLSVVSVSEVASSVAAYASGGSSS